MEEKSQENQLFLSFLNEPSGREGDGDGGGTEGGGGRGIGEGIGGEIRIGGGGRVMGTREEIRTEPDSTFDVNFISNRRHHSLPRKPQLNIRKSQSITSGDDLKRRHQTRDRNFSRANRRKSTSFEQRDEGRDGKVEEEGGRSVGNRKMLLRDWLLKQVNDNDIRGLRWIGDPEKGEKLLRIPWVHESKASWTPDDSKVFQEWAKHTGKFWSNPTDHKRWKSNFRCAINSLPDVEEVTSRGRKTGLEPFKVYRFLPEQPRNQHRKTKPQVSVGEKRRSRRRTTDDGIISGGRPITTTSSYVAPSFALSSLCSSQTVKKEDLSEDEEGESNKSSPSASFLPVISAPDATYRQPMVSFLNNNPSPLSLFTASSSLALSFSSSSLSSSASFVHPSGHPLKEESPQHHGNSTPTPCWSLPNLVPTTVAAMSLDSDDEEEGEGGGGGRQVKSTIDSDRNVIIKEEDSSSSSCSSTDSSSSSSSFFQVVPSSVLPSSVLPSSVLPSSVLPSSVLPSSVLPSSVFPSSVLPSSVLPSSVLSSSVLSSAVLSSAVLSSAVLPPYVLPSPFVAGWSEIDAIDIDEFLKSISAAVEGFDVLDPSSDDLFQL